MGDQTGRVALVTGANSGIGYATAHALADHGAHVILACRDPGRARVAADKMEYDLDRSSIELLTLDLSDLVAVRRAAEQLLAEHARLDLLINNAGVMGTPYRQTADGFELQMATNHLGHFALTGLVLDRLLATARSRVVTVSSVAHRLGRIDFDDVAGLRVGNTWAHYASSKLGNLLFTAELSRRLQAAGAPVMAVAAHPGWTRSNLIGSGAAVGPGKLRAAVGSRLGNTFGQSAAHGARSSLFAATSPDVQPAQFIGPRYELFGPPKVIRPSRQARNLTDAARLWEASEELTEVHYGLPASV
jgi:NAD(P)-dependent dehydrogenase (short-subunit alcohol dehydrogenase family)